MAPDPSDPFAAIELLGHQSIEVATQLTHHELYAYDGLLTLMWHHHDAASDAAVLYCGGALGGVLGPAGGLFHQLGNALATAGIAQGLRVGYRVPNDLGRCVTDTLAAARLAREEGARRFVVVGHSFGGAVAVQTAVTLGAACAGLVTLATQSAGCEPGEALAEAGVPVLLVHGDRDTILPYFASELVRMLIGGELEIIAGADHRFSGFDVELRDRVGNWIADRLS